MESFSLNLADSVVLTRLYNKPHSSTKSPFLPLVVLLHGGTYDAHYFDVDAKHGATLMSNALGVPCVAPNRPGYRDSTSFYPIPAGSNYGREYGLALHHRILPALWSEFGQPQGCNSIILHCHSMGTPGGIFAAGLHAAEESIPRYPLAGVIVSAFGSQTTWRPDPPTGNVLVIPHEAKDQGFLTPGLADPSIYQHSERLNNQSTTIDEYNFIYDIWVFEWREWLAKVEVPVMWAIAARDVLWETTEEHIREVTSAFTRSERVDGSLIKGAPHNMELSYWSHGWYARSFGFALECAASLGLKNAV